MRVIKLYGELGRKFGREYQFDVKTPAEAVRALCSQVEGFKAYLHAHAQDAFKVFVGGRNVSTELEGPSSAQETICIAPVTQGAGAAGRIVLGAVLIIAGFVGNIIAPGNPISPYLFSMGGSMILGGVIQLLSPTPKLNEGPNERPENKPSYNFDGPTNTIAQGHPVPLAYGRIVVGSAVISAGLTTTG